MKLNISLSFALLLCLSSFSLANDDPASENSDSIPEINVTENEKPVFQPSSIEAVFVEQFTDDWKSRWVPSSATKESRGEEVFSYVGEWIVEEPSILPGINLDKGLVLKTTAAHHAISASLPKLLDNNGKTLVVQYEVKLQKGLECGGAYIKLLTDSEQGIKFQEFSDKTPYTIMFGPDKCGSTNKVHFIFRYKNPLTGEYDEKHLRNAPAAKISKLSTLYALVVRPDNTYDILIDNEKVTSGSLLEDFDPPVNPLKEIDDPEDSKPSDWVDDAQIPDPDAKKPDDWDEDAPFEISDEEATKPSDWLDDEPDMIPDPDSEKPDDWDEEEDGEWVPPTVPNPKCEAASGCGEWQRPMKQNPDYKGKWKAPLIDNPAYKGPWAPRKIPNPEFFEDLTPAKFEKISAVGFELWTMQPDILFDNIFIGHSVSDAQNFVSETWSVKRKLEEDEEKKENPPSSDSSDSTSADGVPDVTKDPVGFARHHLRVFIALAQDDPLEAAKQKPAVVGALAIGALSFLRIFFSILGSLFGRSSASDAATRKKTDEPTPDDTDGEITADEKETKSDSSETTTTTPTPAKSQNGENKSKKNKKKKSPKDN